MASVRKPTAKMPSVARGFAISAKPAPFTRMAREIETKWRSQFRVKHRHLTGLYRKNETVDVTIA